MEEPKRKINCILLVDDNPADNYYNKFILKEAGICDHIQTALNGVDALVYLKNMEEGKEPDLYPKPDIVFLDINMPRMNGFEFLAEYTKLDENIKSGIRVLMLTTSYNPEDRQKASNYKDIVGFLHKPLSYEDMLAIISKHWPE